MITAKSNATSISRKIHSIAVRSGVAATLTPFESTRRKMQRGVAVFLAGLLFGCAVTPPAPTPPKPAPPAPAMPVPPPASPPAPFRVEYVPVGWDTLPGWGEDAVQEAWPAFLVGCPALLRRTATAAQWAGPCAAAADVRPEDPAAIRSFLEGHFSPYAVRTAEGGTTGLVTGYYEPLLRGSRTPTDRFRIPLYLVPPDLVTVDLGDLYPELKGRRLRGRLTGRRIVPYWDRAAIDSGRASLAGLELVFVDDPVEAFFLHIQGSGRVALPDGSVMRVGYADQNGHPYRAIGRVLAEWGELPIERTSMQSIREWGRTHPARLPELLAANPSYVFFREVPPPPQGSLEALIDGPIGSLGVPLLARRTAAVDPRAVPLGAPIYLATTYPSTSAPLRRLLLAQDTGGAIRGTIRVDFFWGFGDEAGREAGRMRQDGEVWLLWPKGAPLPGS